MAQFLTYKCDRCGKEFLSTNKEEQPVSIGIVVDFGNGSGKPKKFTFEEKFSAMWCRTCVMKTGLTPPYSQEDKAVAPQQILCFEGKLINLLEEIGFQRAE